MFFLYTSSFLTLCMTLQNILPVAFILRNETGLFAVKLKKKKKNLNTEGIEVSLSCTQ